MLLDDWHLNRGTEGGGGKKKPQNRGFLSRHEIGLKSEYTLFPQEIMTTPISLLIRREVFLSLFSSHF
jgi:hypothetical protein